MSQLYRFFLLAGCVGACFSIGLGAFAAHGLKATLSDKMITVFQTGVDYQAYHCLALIALVALTVSDTSNLSGRYFKASMFLMLSGIVLFSGSLYILAITGITSIGMITPVGGLLLLTAWVFAAVGAWHFGRPHIENKEG